MVDAVSRSMQARTGRSVAHWVALVDAEGPDPLDQKAVRGWLKDVHGVPQNSQWAIASAAAEAAGWQPPSVDQLTDELYSGARSHLRPLHEAVVGLATSLGDDVEVQGRGSYIPVVRTTQFAAVAPGPRGTLRVGLRFRSDPPQDDRLGPAKGFAQATHWIHLAPDTPVEQVSALEPVLRAAYEQN
ncbi:hypothetical protein ADJ73_11350 [Arsenicicoccus sp. oral taxon 190]|nr:hypothetical protein ADJ73_11350 [Arsenicicoccus sp. oral taxon 190]